MQPLCYFIVPISFILPRIALQHAPMPMPIAN